MGSRKETRLSLLSPTARSVVSTSIVVIKRGVLLVVACRACRLFKQSGLRGLVGAALRALRALPGVDVLVDALAMREVEIALRRRRLASGHWADDDDDVAAANSAASQGDGVASTQGSGDRSRYIIRLPSRGLSRHQVLEQLHAINREAAAANGCKGLPAMEGPLAQHFKTLQTVFQSLEPESGAGIDHDSMLRAAFSTFLHDQTSTDPIIIPALRRLETEVVGMTSTLLHGHDEGGDVVGCLTSGGIEAILMAVKAYRDYARKTRPHIQWPEMVVPVTAHPAFDKAAHYFGVRVVHVAVGPDSRVELEAMRGAITPHTILLVASAPQQPHGVVDPVMAVSELAEEYDLPLHVDSGHGGFMLPWMERLGHAVPTWDFRCPGVTSISVDLQKYAYTLRGAGALLYRSSEIRQCQYFAHADWPGGLFASVGLAPRSGGGIAATWAAMVSLGEERYLELARITTEAARKMKDGVRAMEGLGLVADAEMTALAICSRDGELDILMVGDVMEAKGWRLERQQNPVSLHLQVTPQHAGPATDLFLSDLQASIQESLFRPSPSPRTARRLRAAGVPPPSTSSSRMYRLLARLPDRTLVTDFIVKYIDETYRLRPTNTAASSNLLTTARLPSPRSLSNGKDSNGQQNGLARPYLLRHHSSKELELMEGLVEEEEEEEEDDEEEEEETQEEEQQKAAPTAGLGWRKRNLTVVTDSNGSARQRPLHLSMQ